VWLAAAAFSVGMVAAAASDVARRRIPNWLNVALFAAGLALRTAHGWRSLGLGLAGAGVGFALLVLLFQRGWIGGGDVKLATAIGAWLGPVWTAWAVLFGVAANGLVAAAVAIAGGAALRREVATNLKAAALTLSTPAAPERRRAHVSPMALALAASAIVVFIGWFRGGF